MFLKTGKLKDYTYMITGETSNVIVEISHHNTIVDSQDNMSLSEALRYVELYVQKH